MLSPSFPSPTRRRSVLYPSPVVVDEGLPARGRSTTKKALLVGISYDNRKGRNGETLEHIPTSIPNVRNFKKFLEERWGYTNIVVMTDEAGVEERFKPTKTNLKREIKVLRRGVMPGDRRVFYFAGHSDQMPCITGSEEDGMDEVLVALNGLRIRDNTLHSWLVKGLPKGSALTAIFDSCTSGTLLDLGHYRCNNVYCPWVSKGKRKSNTLRNHVVRKNGRIVRSCAMSLPRSRKGSGEEVRFPSLIQILQGISQSPSLGEGAFGHRGERTASPERQFCEGWCGELMDRRRTLPHADVVSISSSNDGQVSWDACTRNGDALSMTSSLIGIIQKHPKITYSKLMTLLNHKVYSYTINMHKFVREQSRARRKGDGKNTYPGDSETDEDKGEMDNFQDLQLGSMTPLDMDRLFEL